MNTRTRNVFFAAFTMMAMAITFSVSALGQRPSTVTAPIYPHDFSDTYYSVNGVKPASIKGRLTGNDFLSVIEKTTHPNYNHVRALITLPAYTETQEARFFNPFGTVSINAISGTAYELASRHLVYVFQNPTLRATSSPFSDLRQAVLFDDASAGYAGEANPLGLHLIISVRFITPTTAKGKIVLDDMASRNGRAADGWPLVKSAADISTLSIYGLIDMSKGNGEVAIVPILDTQNGIAKDAFLSLATSNGKPSDGEMHFLKKFQCLQDGSCN